MKGLSLLLLPLFYLLSLFCQRETGGFTTTSLISYFEPRAEWEAPPLSSEIEKILCQKFHYLGQGGQSFAFVSEDGNYVLKFFKLHRVLLPSLLQKLPLPSFCQEWIGKKAGKKYKKIERDFTSYKLAFEELKEETGLLFLHLNPDKIFKKKLLLVDKLNSEIHLDVHAVPFVLQKRATGLYSHISCLNRDEAEKAFRAVFSLLINRCKKGIFDEDPRLHKNMGFIGERAIIFDAGRFLLDPQRADPEIYKRDLLSMTERFRGWIEMQHPELLASFDRQLTQALDDENKK